MHSERTRAREAPPRQHHARGFTLVELMMITALIAVLASIALPSYSSYRNKARSGAAAQQIVAMSVTIKSYWLDNNAYPPDLASVGQAGMLDPWGRPYVYYNVDANGKGGARKDRALNPINTDFDLYSVGPDGVSKSQLAQKDSVDDVIRARDGRFVGVAADF